MIENKRIGEEQVNAKKLYNLVIGSMIEMVNEKAFRRLIPEYRNHVVAGLNMMINYPNTYIQTRKINKKSLEETLEIVYSSWALNFKNVYKRHREIISI